MKNPIRHLVGSIRGRIIAGVVALHAVLMGLIVADMVSRQQAFMESQVAGEGQSLADTLAANAPAWVLNNDLTALDELVDSLRSVPHLQLAMILDANGKVLATTDPGLFNLVLNDGPSRALMESGRQLRHDGMLDSISRINSGDRHIGYARVILNSSAIQRELDIVTHKGMVYTLVAIVLGGVIAWLLVRGMTMKLRRLSQAADVIAEGDLNVTLADASGTDEVARLTRDFNQMAHALRHDREQRSRFEQALFAEKERAQVTLHSIGDGVITTDILGQVEYLNPVAEKLTGWRTDAARGLPLQDVYRIIDETTRCKLENPVDQALRRNGVVTFESPTLLLHRDGREFSIEDSAAPIRDRSGEIIGVVLVFHDNTQSHAMAQQLSYQASHDALTGLINRRELEVRLSELIVEAGEAKSRHALLYLDLDQFKVVNDTSGHAAGDELLRQLTVVLQGMVDDGDMLARLGGDEFGMLLPNRSIEEAQAVAERMIRTIEQFNFNWEGKIFTVGASVGLAAIDEDSPDWATLLSQADSACYLAKERGRNRVQVFRSEDAELAQRHYDMHWVGRIARAIEQKRFLLYYQPIIPVESTAEALPHFEVLVRMRDEDGRIVRPGAFIPAAERFHLMQNLDRWVLDKTFAWLSRHRDVPMICAINVSGHSIGDERFLDYFVAQLNEYRVSPNNICLEITETAAIARLNKAVQLITQLKALGCRFALDDFGAGLSSFAYLKNLPVDYLKIDGSFVRDIDHNETSLAMVDAINRIGHTMKIQTIAEFVENPAILKRLQAQGVDFAQGNAIGMPAPLEEFEPA